MTNRLYIFIVLINIAQAGCSDGPAKNDDDVFGFLVGTPNRSENGISVCISPGNEYIIIGQYLNSNNTAFPYIVKTFNNGDTIWTRSLTDTANLNIIELASDQGYIVAGYTRNYSFSIIDAMMMKIDQNGNSVWSAVFDNYRYIAAIKATPDGGYIALAGGYKMSPTAAQMGLLKLDGSGNLLWEKRYVYDGTGFEIPKAVEPVADGYLILVGSYGSYSNTPATYFMKTDNSGDTLWVKILSREINFSSLYKNSSGQFLLAGNGRIKRYNNFYQLSGLMKLDSNGNILLHKTINVRNDNLIKYIFETSNGEYILAGDGGNYGNDAVVMKCDSFGNWLWSKLYSHNFSMKHGNNDQLVMIGTALEDNSGIYNYTYDIFVFVIDPEGMIVK